MFKQRQGCGGYRNPEGVDRSREVRKGRVQIANGGGKAGNFGMKGRIQVTSWWDDDHMQRHDRRQWRGCWSRRVLPPLPPPEGHQTAEREGGVGQE